MFLKEPLLPRILCSAISDCLKIKSGLNCNYKYTVQSVELIELFKHNIVELLQSAVSIHSFRLGQN